MKIKVSKDQLADLNKAASALNEAIYRLETFKTGLVFAGVGTYAVDKEHKQTGIMLERLNRMSTKISKKIKNSVVCY